MFPEAGAGFALSVCVGTWNLLATHSAWDLSFGPDIEEHFYHHNGGMESRKYNLGIVLDHLHGTSMPPPPGWAHWDAYGVRAEEKEEGRQSVAQNRVEVDVGEGAAEAADAADADGGDADDAFDEDLAEQIQEEIIPKFDEDLAEQIQEETIPKALRFNSPGRKAPLSIFLEGKRQRKVPARFVTKK
jgi:hypothetical protein